MGINQVFFVFHLVETQSDVRFKIYPGFTELFDQFWVNLNIGVLTGGCFTSPYPAQARFRDQIGHFFEDHFCFFVPQGIVFAVKLCQAHFIRVRYVILVVFRQGIQVFAVSCRSATVVFTGIQDFGDLLIQSPAGSTRIQFDGFLKVTDSDHSIALAFHLQSTQVQVVGRQNFIWCNDFKVAVQDLQAALIFAVFIVAISLQAAEVVFSAVFLENFLHQIAGCLAVFVDVQGIRQLHFIFDGNFGAVCHQVFICFEGLFPFATKVVVFCLGAQCRCKSGAHSDGFIDVDLKFFRQFGRFIHLSQHKFG